MKKLTIIAAFAVIAISCQKKEAVSHSEPVKKYMGYDTYGEYLEANYSQYGDIHLAPPTYVPSQDFEYTELWLLDQADPEGDNVEFYYFGGGVEPPAFECTRTWVQGDRYVYCPAGGSSCEYGTVDGDRVLIKCDQ